MEISLFSQSVTRTTLTSFQFRIIPRSVGDFYSIWHKATFSVDKKKKKKKKKKTGRARERERNWTTVNEKQIFKK